MSGIKKECNYKYKGFSLFVLNIGNVMYNYGLKVKNVTDIDDLFRKIRNRIKSRRGKKKKL